MQNLLILLSQGVFYFYFTFTKMISYQQGLKRSVSDSKRLGQKAMPLHRVQADLLTMSEIDFVNTLEANKNK